MKRTKWSSRSQVRPNPSLRFTPTAWAKLLFLRDIGPTEVGAFGITSPQDLLLVREIQLVRQRCTEAFVSFDDVAVAEHFEQQVDLGRRPEQCGRIWIHTHPGDSPSPSHVDVQTFQRAFGHCDWAVMFILARGGRTFAELAWHQGNSLSFRLGVEIDYSHPFQGTDHELWEQEYLANVEPRSWHDPRLLDQEDEWLQFNPLGSESDLADPSGARHRGHHSDSREPVAF